MPKVLTNRKRLKVYAQNLRKGTLPKAVINFLADALEQISEGRDANEMLEVKYSAGQSISDEIARQDLALKFHMIMAYIDKEGGNELSVTQALKAVSQLSQLPNSLKPVGYTSLRARWYKKENEYLKKLEFSPLDEDSPYPV